MKEWIKLKHFFFFFYIHKNVRYKNHTRCTTSSAKFRHAVIRSLKLTIIRSQAPTLVSVSRSAKVRGSFTQICVTWHIPMEKKSKGVGSHDRPSCQTCSKSIEKMVILYVCHTLYYTNNIRTSNTLAHIVYEICSKNEIHCTTVIVVVIAMKRKRRNEQPRYHKTKRLRISTQNEISFVFWLFFLFKRFRIWFVRSYNAACKIGW